MYQSAIICTGTELLSDKIHESNSLFLARRLEENGFRVDYKIFVGDNIDAICSVMEFLLPKIDLMILSGGLGSTVDDLTRDAISKISGRKLIFHPQLLEKIENRIRQIHPGKQFLKSISRQAYIPENAEIFYNVTGTAPGFGLEFNKKIIIALPGPPKELNPIWDFQVKDWLKSVFPGDYYYHRRMIHCYGLPESMVNDKIYDLFINSVNPKIGIYSKPGLVDIGLMGWGESKNNIQQALSKLESEIRARLGDFIYGADNDNLESIVGKLLKEKKLYFAIAESCTGGYIAHRITNIAGSSDYFDCGIVSYSNHAKRELLHIPDNILTHYGAVSEQTARAMAEGILKISQADIGMAVTGIAGPGGGSKDKPVGLIYIAIADKKGYSNCYKYQFNGDREIIKFRTAMETLDILRRYLIKK